jgi:hypothetical protein
VFEQAIDRSEPAEEVKQRVVNLIDCITFSVFVYTSRGLFERDKLIFTAQMTFLVRVFFSKLVFDISNRILLFSQFYYARRCSMFVHNELFSRVANLY